MAVPVWVKRPLPLNHQTDDAAVRTIERVARELPQSVDQLESLADRAANLATYDVVANRACELVWESFSRGDFEHEDYLKFRLMRFAIAHFPPRAQARVLRHLVKDPDLEVRRRAESYSEKLPFNEVALPARERRSDSDAESEWNKGAWLHGLNRETREHFRPSATAQQRLELPRIGTIGELRELLGIRSPRQLGWMLLATDNDGPYSTFTIPKRTGADRTICAPGWQLRNVQQRLLRKVLYQVPVHRAAHGFVPGRSTVTNASAHVGQKVVVKFDLQDFFPSIHHFRIVGLFVSLGYDYADGRFSVNDKSAQVAPTLARLCSYTSNPAEFGQGHLPQGAPTSPAITNLICRTLDSRLTGLARANGGRYTRYADDLTFSFGDDIPHVGRFRWWVDQICHQEGFRVHQGKFRVIRSSQRQTVTGIVVNDGLRIPREQRRRFRAIVHNCVRHGVDSQARDNPSFRSWLRGFASYMHMIHPDEGGPILQQVRALLGDQPEAGVE